MHAQVREPFVAQYEGYAPPPSLPPRPPPHLLAPSEGELLAASLVSTLSCAAGGIVWGALAGALRSSARARRPVWRSALLTAAGAALFEALLQLKGTAHARVRTLGAPDAVAAAPPPYATLRGLAMATSADVALSSVALLAIIQPRRAPFAFGGWALGKLIHLSQEVVIDIEVVE